LSSHYTTDKDMIEPTVIMS